jgi:hypothetical protein
MFIVYILAMVMVGASFLGLWIKVRRWERSQ